MSFEDIKEAQVKYTVKEVIKDKRKRGQKRKSTILVADDPEPEPEVVYTMKEVINSRGKRGRK